jgi:hypothetical protein
LADLGERVQIVSRAGSKIRVRSERSEEFEVEEKFTTIDLDEMATIVATRTEKRKAAAIASKVLQRATLEAAATPSEMPKNEQQVGLRKFACASSRLRLPPPKRERHNYRPIIPNPSITGEIMLEMDRGIRASSKRLE